MPSDIHKITQKKKENPITKGGKSNKKHVTNKVSKKKNKEKMKYIQ